MNLILLFDADFTAPCHVRLTGRRFEHIRTVLKSKAGDELCIGLLNGQIGQGRIVKMDGEAVEISAAFTQAPPLALPLTLIIPMIRPPMFKRLLFHATTLGIKKIIILNFSRVEKSLWQSSALRPQAIQESLVLGLEQAKDTVLPQVIIKDRFKPFVEDELPALAEGTLKLTAHPGGDTLVCPLLPEPVTLVIGPEGGFVPYEIKKLAELDFKIIDLGPRILRVDTAISYIIGRVF